MPLETIKAGTTSKIAQITLRDSSTGQPLTGIAYGDVTIKVHVGDAVPATLTPVTATAGTFTSEGWVETSDTGQYQFGARNADLANAGKTVKYTFTASGAITATYTYDVQAVNADDASAFGLTNLTGHVPQTADHTAAIAAAQADLDSLTDDGVNVLSIEDTDATDYFDAMAAVITLSLDVYHAAIELTVDDANSQDEYTITWFKNGVRVTSGITDPTIQVVKRADGTDLIASATPTEIGSTGSYKHDETTNRLTAGEAALCIVGATIDGSARSFEDIVGRDSTA